jgi:nucleoside-diphosphate-sugar epimerase
MTPLRIGVTGATGQVGSRLLRHLRRAGFDVVAAVRNPLGAALCEAIAPDVDIRVGSLVVGGHEPHLLDDCDVIVNCALESSGGIPRQAYTRNRELIDGLLRARALKWLVHLSTVAVYGELITRAADDDRARTRPVPGSEYGRSKLYVERYASQRARRRRLRYTAIRLGHVYGAGIARSREIVELASTSGFELPFGGELSSNAIHADNLGAAIVGLLKTSAPAEVYGLCEASSTWRDVFDWHTACLGLPPVPGMSDAESRARRTGFLRRSPARDAIAWLRHLPLKSLVRSPATFDLALRALVKTPSAITQAVSDMNRRSGALGHIARADAAAARDVAALYLSDGMPGPFLDIPAPPDDGLGSAMERARELREWHELWRRPRMRAATRPHVDAGSSPAGPVTWR